MSKLFAVDFTDLLDEGETVGKYAVVTNGDKMIFTDNELVHNMDNLNDTGLYHFYTFPTNRTFSLTPLELFLRATQEVDAREWIHYFGIKDRIHRNYNLFVKSLKEIGVDPTFLPAWNASD